MPMNKIVTLRFILVPPLVFIYGDSDPDAAVHDSDFGDWARNIHPLMLLISEEFFWYKEPILLRAEFPAHFGEEGWLSKHPPWFCW